MGCSSVGQNDETTRWTGISSIFSSHVRHLKRRDGPGVSFLPGSLPLSTVKVDSDLAKRDLPVVIFYTGSNLMCRLSGLVALARYFSIRPVSRRLSIQKCSVGFFSTVSIGFLHFSSKAKFPFIMSYYRARFLAVSRDRDPKSPQKHLFSDRVLVTSSALIALFPANIDPGFLNRSTLPKSRFRIFEEGTRLRTIFSPHDHKLRFISSFTCEPTFHSAFRGT